MRLQAQEAQPFTRKDGGETRKRSILLRDDSNRSIELTLWGGYADDPGNVLEEVGPHKAVWQHGISTGLCGSMASAEGGRQGGTRTVHCAGKAAAGLRGQHA